MLVLLNRSLKCFVVIMLSLCMISISYAEAGRAEKMSILDIDADGNVDAPTDGLLILRSMFGLTDGALTTGLVASDAASIGSVDIESRITMLGDLADIDGNGNIDALTDGLLTLRYLFGREGNRLVAGVVAADATRTTAVDIEAHLKALMLAL
jgi:hypothetical protein